MMERNYSLPMLLIGLLAMPAAIAATDAFSDAYQSYQTAIQSKDWQRSLSSSALTLEEGLKIFDQQGENIANLRLNHANELIRARQFEQAIDQLNASLDAKTANLGAQSPELVDVLMPLGKSIARTSLEDAIPHFSRAIQLTQGNDALRAQLRLNAGLALFSAGDRKTSQDYLSEAQQYYSQRFGTQDIRNGIASLNLGRIYFEDRNYGRALPALNMALEAFGSPDPIARQFNAATRKMLVVVLETTGEREKATEHCIALAMLNSVEGNSEAELVFSGRDIKPPMIGVRDSNGINARTYGATIVVKFDIDEEGYVVNTDIASSTSASMNATALEIAISLRYSPRIEDGKPVLASGFEYRYKLAEGF